MSALTDRLLADKDVKHNRDQCIGLSSCAEDEQGRECPLCAEQVDHLIESVVRALAGETLDAAETAARSVWGRSAEECPDIQQAIETAAPLLRAPLLVQVAELEAQLAAAREAMDALKEFGCSDGYCVLRGPAKGMHTNGGCRCLLDLKASHPLLPGRLGNALTRLHTALTGATRQEDDR